MQVDNALLELLCQKNSFVLPAEELVFLGIRGALPASSSTDMANEVDLRLAQLNYKQPRCTLLQWNRTTKQIAAFPGSTVASLKNIEKSVTKAGQGTNEMLTGLYLDFRKGKHKAAAPTGHDAFRQTEKRPIRRTKDDVAFTMLDPVTFELPNDNLHAGWCSTVDGNYDSAGCQVVVGLPACAQRGTKPSTEPWRTFQTRAYAGGQTAFPYILTTGGELERLINRGGLAANKLSFGSTGDAVQRLRKQLRTVMSITIADGKVFDFTVLDAVLRFQSSRMGIGHADGIVGPATAEFLGLTL